MAILIAAARRMALALAALYSFIVDAQGVGGDGQTG
jgi:hypothetical protein